MPKLTAIRKQVLDGMMKQAMFEATVSALSTHGVDGLTMDRVALEAGVAKGSLYRYFRSKRDLIEFVFAKLIDPIFQDLEQTVTRQQPAIEKLSSHLHVLLEHVAKHAEVHRLLFEDDAAHGLLQSSERRSSEAACHQLAEIIRQGMEERVIRAGDPQRLAAMYLGLCKGILQSRPQLDRPEQREELHRLILDTFLHGAAIPKTENT